MLHDLIVTWLTTLPVEKRVAVVLAFPFVVILATIGTLALARVLRRMLTTTPRHHYPRHR